MSDLAAAAAALGVPEAITERSARARAAATGQSYEDVLAAWAGGEPMSAGDVPPPAPALADEAPQDAPEEASAEASLEAAPPPPAASPAPMPAATAPPVPTGAVSGPPPILDAAPDRPLLVVVGGLAVLVMAILLGFVMPALPAASDEVRSSNFPLTQTAATGRDVYARAGCASCHTQVIRSVVADFGVGPVTLGDTNQILGYRRIGPDLANAGGRLGLEELEAAVTGPAHPPMTLSAEAVGALGAYLSETGVTLSGGDS